MTIGPPRQIFRSYFYVPSHREEVAHEAYASDADAVVFDLEGLVPDAEKDAGPGQRRPLAAVEPDQADARAHQHHRQRPRRRRHRGDGRRPTSTPSARRRPSGPTTSARSPASSTTPAAAIGRVDPIGLQVMIESALGLERAFAIALATDSIWSLGLGEGDLRHDLGTATDEGLAFARSRIVNAARAAGLPGPVQVAYPPSGSLDGLRASTERGLSLGFTGRSITTTAQAPGRQRDLRPLARLRRRAPARPLTTPRQPAARSDPIRYRQQEQPMTDTVTDIDLDVRPLSGWTGAEIHGVDLAAPLSDATIAAIRDAWLRWKVIFFRNQHLDHAGHVAIVRRFGALTDPQPYDQRDPELYALHPEIEKISSKNYGNRFNEKFDRRATSVYNPGAPSADGRNRTLNYGGWHADWTPAINPPIGTFLRSHITPPFGGDTQWTNTVAAYEGLAEPVRAFVDGLWAEHRYGQTYVPLGPDEPFAQWLADKPARVASIRSCGCTPRPASGPLYVNPSFTRPDHDVSPRESQKILELLFDQIGRPEYTVRFKWEPGDVAFWDNRSVLHLIPSDYFHLGFERELYRSTLAGEVPVSVDGRESIPLEGEPFPVW